VTDRDLTDLEEAFHDLSVWAEHFNLPMPTTAAGMELGLKTVIVNRMKQIQAAESLRETFEITPSKIDRANIDRDTNIAADDWELLQYAINRYPYLRYYADMNNNGLLDYDVILIAGEVIVRAEATETPQPSFLRNVDINGDGIFNILDIETITKALKYHVDADGDGDVDADDPDHVREVKRFVDLGVVRDIELLFTKRTGQVSAHYADQKLRFHGKDYFVAIGDNGRFTFTGPEGETYLSFIGLDFVKIDDVIADVFLDEDGRVVLEEKHDAGQPYEISTHLADEVISLGGVLYDVRHDLDDGTYDIYKGEEEVSSIIKPEGSLSQSITIDGTDYLAYTGAGNISGRLILVLAGDSGTRVYEQTIRVEGAEYRVKRNADGTFTFSSDLDTRTSVKDAAKVLIGGVVYDIHEDFFNGRVTLSESYKASREICGQVLEVDSRTFEVRSRLDGTYEFVEIQGVVPTGYTVTSKITKQSDTGEGVAYVYQVGHTLTIPAAEGQPDTGGVFDVVRDYETGKIKLVEQYSAVESRFNYATGKEELILFTYDEKKGFQEEVIPVMLDAEGKFHLGEAVSDAYGTIVFGGYYSRPDKTSAVDGTFKISYNAETGRIRMVEEHKVSQTLLGQLISIDDIPYEVVRNQDGSITFRDIVYASKRYISDPSTNKVNIEGYLYDIILSPYTQDISLIEEHTRQSEHLNDGVMMIAGTSYYVFMQTDGGFTLSDKKDLSDPAGRVFVVDQYGNGTVEDKGAIYDAVMITRTEGVDADINLDGGITTADVSILLEAISRMVQVDITGDGYADRRDLERMNQIILGIETGELLDPSEYYRADMNSDGKVDHLDWEAIETAFAKLYLATDMDSDGYVDYRDWQKYTQDHPATGVYTTVYEGIDVPARSLTGDALFGREDVQAVRRIQRFMTLGAAYDMPEAGLGIYSSEFTVYAAASPELVARYDINDDGIVDAQDVQMISDAVNNVAKHDINGDYVLNEEDLSAWDSVLYFSSLALNIQPEDINTANLTGDMDYYYNTGIVDAADLARYKEISGYNEVTGTFRNFDVNLDGQVNATDVSYISRVNNLNNLLTTSILPFLKAKLDVDWTATPGEKYILNFVDMPGGVEDLLLPWADVNADGVVDSKDQATYEVLYMDYMNHAGVPVSLDIAQPSGIGPEDRAMVLAVIDYLEDLPLYGDEREFDMTNILAMKATLDMLETGVAAHGALPGVSGTYTTAAAYLTKVLAILSSADFDGDGMLTTDDLARMNDAYEAEVIRDRLSITVKEDLYIDLDNDGYLDYDINKDGAIDHKDLSDLKAAYRDFAKYDVAGYASVDVNGDGNIDQNDLEIAPDGMVNAADLAFLEIADRFMRLDYELTDSELILANITGDFASDGSVILNEADYEAIAYYMPYVRDVDENYGLKAIMELSSDDYARLMQIVKSGGMTRESVTAQGLSRLDLNGDGIISESDMETMAGGIDLRDVLAVQSAAKIIAEKGITLEEITRVDVNFDGVLDQRDIEKFEELFEAQDLTDPEVLAKVQALDSIQFHGARIPLNWIVSTDVNKDGNIDQTDEDLLERARMYRSDVNLDGKIDHNDLQAIDDVIKSGVLAFTASEIIAGDLNADSSLDEFDLRILTKAVSQVSSYDLTSDGIVD
ncbi:MAG: hypothetical protein PHT95_04115, partial [Candidatus Omnitrophica bacterium]|nr:hypothetical protein [Candidatus Omnitrophota bacterium]